MPCSKTHHRFFHFLTRPLSGRFHKYPSIPRLSPFSSISNQVIRTKVFKSKVKDEVGVDRVGEEEEFGFNFRFLLQNYFLLSSFSHSLSFFLTQIASDCALTPQKRRISVINLKVKIFFLYFKIFTSPTFHRLQIYSIANAVLKQKVDRSEERERREENLNLNLKLISLSSSPHRYLRAALECRCCV